MSSEPPAPQPPASPQPASQRPPAPWQPVSPPAAQPVPAAAPKRAVRTWDVVVTVILLVLLGVLALFMSFLGFFLAMASDSCGARECNTELIAVGMLTAVVLPWVWLVVGAVVAIVLLVKRRVAFWVPLVAALLVIGSWPLGAWIASSGVPAG